MSGRSEMNTEREKESAETEKGSGETSTLRNAWAMLNEVIRKRTPEPRYAYYRRCLQFRKNGKQCRAPALKGESLCYMHDAQARAEIKYQQSRRELGVRNAWNDRRSRQQAIGRLAEAVLNDRIDRKSAARMVAELQAAITLRKAERSEAAANQGAPFAAPEGHSTIESNR
jgi:hypothetical protein